MICWYSGLKVGEPAAADDAHGTDAVAQEEALPRKAGMLVAVAADAADLQDKAVQVLREQGAADIERSSGEIAGGDWTDFDPLRPVALVS